MSLNISRWPANVNIFWCMSFPIEYLTVLRLTKRFQTSAFWVGQHFLHKVEQGTNVRLSVGGTSKLTSLFCKKIWKKKENKTNIESILCDIFQSGQWDIRKTYPKNCSNASVTETSKTFCVFVTILVKGIHALIICVYLYKVIFH